MTVELTESYDGKVLTIQMSGKLTAEDYEQFVPLTERLIDQHGQIRILIDMQGFHGWSLAALWEDLKFDIKHFNDIERLAMVGDRTWEKWMATFCKPFTSAEIRYFDQSESDEAGKWISDGLSN
ncbi:hypothetical protein MNBD_PLANCTO02-3171 [hydrothermal vent metagenome]|uniref:STAS/SEC14 domain-containing protein n=1 Tax=hydrothermal vent metagenome TaxID=652676 RepID=A0A3B1DYF9_9ZZZZ